MILTWWSLMKYAFVDLLNFDVWVCTYAYGEIKISKRGEWICYLTLLFVIVLMIPLLKAHTTGAGPILIISPVCPRGLALIFDKTSYCKSLEISKPGVLGLGFHIGSKSWHHPCEAAYKALVNFMARLPLVSDPSMHHGTCVTHVPWCMSGSLTCGGGENVPCIFGACATRNCTYLARGP